MAPTSSYYYQPTSALPVDIPGNKPLHQYRHAPRTASSQSQYSVSPPEQPESISTSSAGLYSSASSQYGGSESDNVSSGGTSVDLLDYMNDRLGQTYSSVSMDRSMAKQAQMSGALNAKNRELLALQAQARARLAKTRANFAEGMKTAREVQRDLEWTHKKVHALNARAATKYPDQYRAARERYPTFEE